MSLKVNGQSVSVDKLRKGYAQLRRHWSDGDTIQLDLPMPIHRIASHPRVEANSGRAALQRGPVVYCVEAVDHDGRVRDLLLSPDAPLAAEHRSQLLGGVTVLKGTALRVPDNGEPRQPVDLLAVPYAVWANREIGEMDVWIKQRRAE